MGAGSKLTTQPKHSLPVSRRSTTDRDLVLLPDRHRVFHPPAPWSLQARIDQACTIPLRSLRKYRPPGLRHLDPAPTRFSVLLRLFRFRRRSRNRASMCSAQTATARPLVQLGTPQRCGLSRLRLLEQPGRLLCTCPTAVRQNSDIPLVFRKSIKALKGLARSVCPPSVAWGIRCLLRA